MVKVLYCWRCSADMPMLEEHEWEEVVPQLRDGRGMWPGALERYFQLSGYRETNINALWHHRVSQYGPPCKVCGKPLRTPKAKMCAACGAST